MTDTLDIDDEATWSEEIRLTIGQIIVARPEILEAKDDDELLLTFDERNQIEDLLRRVPVVMYHATRFLPHEIDLVNRDGLKPLSKDLVSSRIDGAVASGDLDKEVAIRLLEAVLCGADDENRRAQICFATSRNAIRSRAHFQNLFGYWGGEVIYGDLIDDFDMRARLSIGQPTLIKAVVFLDSPTISFCNFDPTLCLVAVKAGIRAEGTIHLSTLPLQGILEVITSNHPDWEVIQPLSID